jgi:hypothetical protein
MNKLSLLISCIKIGESKFMRADLQVDCESDIYK